ncbi:MAG TPA: Ig-like domain repeat protein [Blastocatellia bacterium]|nr:Ig-like domain repeat protein [Blastocatellia bacterium]
MDTIEKEYHGLGCNWIKRSLRLTLLVILSLVGLLSTNGNAQCLPAITISPDAPLPNGMTGMFYSQTFKHQGGGYSEVSWHIPYGAVLPPGLTLNHDTGVLSGTPTTAGTYYFFVRATATSNGWCYGERNYGITVKAATVMTFTVSNDPVTVGQKITLTAQVSATGGVTPTGTVQFAVDGAPVGSAVPLVGGIASTDITAPNGGSNGSFLTTAVYSGSESAWPNSGRFMISVYHYSLQDDATGDQLFFSSNGNYIFKHYDGASSLILKGKGTILPSILPCTVFLQHNAADREVRVEFNTCEQVGAATVIYQGVAYSLSQGSK